MVGYWQRFRLQHRYYRLLGRRDAEFIGWCTVSTAVVLVRYDSYYVVELAVL